MLICLPCVLRQAVIVNEKLDNRSEMTPRDETKKQLFTGNKPALKRAPMTYSSLLVEIRYSLTICVETTLVDSGFFLDMIV